jgi:hypothetical protein
VRCLLSLYYVVVKVKIPKGRAEKILVAGFVVILVLAFAVGYKYANKTHETEKNEPVMTDVTPEIKIETIKPEVKESDTFYNMQKQWLFIKSKEIGVSFTYPVPAGEISFEYGDYEKKEASAAGQFYLWKIVLSSEAEKGLAYNIAGGVSENFQADKDLGILQFYNIQAKDYTEAKNVFKTKYGTDAIWRSSDKGNFTSYVLVDLPIKKVDVFKGIAIYFRDKVTQGDVEKVIKSLSVE